MIPSDCEYHSAFKGRGMTFAEVREYQYGDDIRDIDWNVTARHNKPYVKVYEEERELTVMLLVDVSHSRLFGAVGEEKREIMAEIAATIAYSAITNNDKIGVLFFSDRIEKFIPPKKGRRHVLFIIRELLDFQPQGVGTDIAAALRYFTDALKKRTTTFLISDFIDTHDYSQALSIASNRHDVIGIQVYDKRDTSLPPVGHLLKGMTAKAKDITGFIFNKLGVNAVQIETLLDNEISHLPRVQGGEPYLSADTNRVLMRAQDISKEMGDEFAPPGN